MPVPAKVQMLFRATLSPELKGRQKVASYLTPAHDQEWTSKCVIFL